jgi:hypothetical protein
MKKQIIVAFIVVGAIVIATPIFVLGMFRLVWELAISLATPKAPIVTDKIRQLAAAAETRMSGRTDK